MLERSKSMHKADMLENLEYAIDYLEQPLSSSFAQNNIDNAIYYVQQVKEAIKKQKIRSNNDNF